MTEVVQDMSKVPRLPPLRVGQLTIDPPLILAPMADVTDLPFRTICEELGAGFTITEFLSAQGLALGAEKLRRKLASSAGQRPFGVQLFGRDKEALTKAALMAVEAGASLIDLNMGCPARKIVGETQTSPESLRGCGAALMLEGDLAARLVEALRCALPPSIPVTVKMRAGWDARTINAPDLAARMASAGAAMVTVHGRTRSQGYGGTVDLGVIRRVRERVPKEVPVCGNGDVVDIPSFERMVSETGCNAVMIGRGAIGNPWIFADLRAHLFGLKVLGRPDRREKLRVLMRHLALVRAHDPQNLVHEAQKLICRYAKGEPGAARLRAAVMAMKEVEELTEAASRFFAR